ncbi:MAG: CaiB/BaiF CoA transferase family protein [Tepidiformaceae bacterium]
MNLLEGLLVLDMGRHHAGPYCAKLLADAGADVIHVEHPGGDPTRATGPFGPDDDARELSASFAFLNAGKRSVTLDYTTPEGAALLWELIERADILIENGAPGTLERYGFGNDALLAMNPRLVRISVTNYGLTGPNRDLPASEMTLQAASGLMDGNGDLGREPLRYPVNMSQHWAGANAASAGMVAYWHALMTGQGQQVDVSIQESLANTWFMVYADYAYTGGLQARGQKDLLPASDGKVMIRWQTSVPWEEFAIAMDAMELLTDPELQPPSMMVATVEKYQATLAGHTAERTRREWMDRAIEHEIPAGMLQSLDDIANCEQHEARGFWDRLQLPGGKEVKFPGNYFLVNDESRTAEVRHVPKLGEHNADVYGGMLGRSAEELAQLRAKGAI